MVAANIRRCYADAPQEKTAALARQRRVLIRRMVRHMASRVARFRWREIVSGLPLLAKSLSRGSLGNGALLRVAPLASF
jgi:hypothetical protein